MAVAQRMACTVERIVEHGERVYSVSLRPERTVPRFRAGQFLHLALDRYEPGGFWPDSRVFSIASPSTRRDALRITYAVHGSFTERMEQVLREGEQVWIKLPYGDFVVEGDPVVLVAGGTGMTAFSAFLESAAPGEAPEILVAYGARSAALLIYRDLVETTAGRLASMDATFFVERGELPEGRTDDRVSWRRGRVAVDAIWPKVGRLDGPTFFLSGPPPMIRAIESDLRARSVPAEAIRIDAWD